MVTMRPWRKGMLETPSFVIARVSRRNIRPHHLPTTAGAVRTYVEDDLLRRNMARAYINSLKPRLYTGPHHGGTVTGVKVVATDQARLSQPVAWSVDDTSASSYVTSHVT